MVKAVCTVLYHSIFVYVYALPAFNVLHVI